MRKLMLFAMILAVMFSAIGPFGMPQAQAAPFSILKNTVWSGLMYMPEGIYIGPDATLTIMPGTIVKLGAVLSVKGSLISLGTKKEPILFTSIKDDVYEDTNKDKNVTKPEPGDWSNVELPENCGKVEISYTNFKYGGKGGFGTLKLSAGKGADDRIRIINCEVSHSASQGIWMSNCTSVIRECFVSNCKDPAKGVGIWIQTNSKPSVSGCVIEDCTIAMQVDLSSSPRLLGNVAKNCSINGINVPTGDIGSEILWDANLPYVCDKMVILKNGILNIQPGVIVKSNGIINVSGRLNVKGTKENPVFMTSINDDSVGGDTNNNKEAIKPNPGDWAGIEFVGDAGECVLTYVNLSYGGGQSEKGGGFGIVKFGAMGGVDSRVKLYNCNVSNSQTAGMYFQASSPSIFNCTVSGNRNEELGAAFWLQSRSKPIVYNCTLVDSKFAFYCDGFSYPKAIGCKIEGNKFNNIYFESPLLEEDAVWGADMVHYIPKTIGINPNVTLHLLPGVIIKFGNMVRVDGKLIAVGTKEKPIYFTSLADDAIGGDSNGDSVATSPLPGDNESVQFIQSKGRSILKNCIIRYGGNGGNGNLHLGQAPNTKNEQLVENCVIEKSLGEAIKVQSGKADIISCTIRDCMNKTNGYALRAEKGARVRFVGNTIEKVCNLFDISPEVELLTKNNTAKQMGDPMTGGNAGIRILKGRLRQDMTWNSEFPYILEEDFTIDKTARLTVLPGNVIKVRSGAIYVNGAFDCKGTEKKPIYFTSIKDDTVAGDANLDGQNSKPLPGDFDEIEFEGSVKDCTFSHVVVRWGGGKTRRMGAVKFGAFTGVDERVKWVNCTIENSNSAGFYLINSSPYIEKCIVKGCATADRGHGVYTTGVCQPKITDCNFEDCEFATFNNMPNTQLVIENSWFGDKTGPKDEAENKEGKGLKVHGNVMYRPFMEEPIATCGAGGSNGSLPQHSPPEIDFPMPDTSAEALIVEPTLIMVDKGSNFEVVAKGGVKPYVFKSIDETSVKLVTAGENGASFSMTGGQPSIIQVTDSSDQQVNVWVVSKTIKIPEPLFTVNPLGVPVKVGQTATFQVTEGYEFTATLEPGKSASITGKENGQIKILSFARGVETMTVKSATGASFTCKIFCIADEGMDSSDPYEFHAIPGDSAARLVWKLPNIQKTAYSGAIITMDGKKLSEVGPETSSYQVTGLANGKVYNFSIKNISGGQEIKTTCKPYAINIKLQLTIGKSEAVINGQKVQIDKSPSVTPIVIKGSTYVPFRFLAESLGADVGWVQAKKEANFWTPRAFIQMYVGSTDGFLFGSPIKVSPAPEMVNGKVMIPLRAASELLGAKVEYNSKTRQITINYAKPWFGWW